MSKILLVQTKNLFKDTTFSRKHLVKSSTWLIRLLMEQMDILQLGEYTKLL